MPTDHPQNTANGNAVARVANAATAMRGRTSNLVIRSVDKSKLLTVVGDGLTRVIDSMNADGTIDATNRYRQPTNHEDRDGNLPVGPDHGVEYREYYIDGNKLPKASYLRLVWDVINDRLYITPTHYDIWISDRDTSTRSDVKTAFTATTPNANNPFFLINKNA